MQITQTTSKTNKVGSRSNQARILVKAIPFVHVGNGSCLQISQADSHYGNAPGGGNSKHL